MKQNQQEINNFMQIANLLIGLPANLHFYQNHLCKIGIMFDKNGKRIILGFLNVSVVKVNTRWIFDSIEIEKLQDNQYKIYDRNNFEIICQYFGVFEEILDLKKTKLNLQINQRKLQPNFSLLFGKVAKVFRYDRWLKLLILEFLQESTENEEYLIFDNCEWLEFDSQKYFNLSQFQITNNSQTIGISDKSNNFFVKCSSIYLWNEKTYDLYLDQLIESVGTEFCNPIMEPIYVEDLERMGNIKFSSIGVKKP